MRVLVAEPLAAEGIALLRAAGHQVDVRLDLSRQDFLAVLPDYEALIVRSQVKVDAEALAAAGKLIVVGRAGVGVDNIDLDAATRAGVAAVNAPTANTVAAAEQTLGLIYALARRIPGADASVRRGDRIGRRRGGADAGPDLRSCPAHPGRRRLGPPRRVATC